MALTRSARLMASLGRPAAAGAVALFNSAALNRAVEVETAPLEGLAHRVAQPFAPLLDELAKPRKGADSRAEDRPLYVPNVPKVLCISRMAAESQLLRDVLVVDPAKPLPKPRLSWYNPYDSTWIPSGWFAEGLVADMHYYFGDLPKSSLSPPTSAPAPPQPTGA